MGKKDKLKRSTEEEVEEEDVIVPNVKVSKKHRSELVENNEDDEDKNEEEDADLIREKKKKRKKEKREREAAELVKDVSEGAAVTSELVYTGYIPHKDIIAMSEEEADERRTNLGIQIYPSEAIEQYKPLYSFDHIQPTLKNFCPEVSAYIQLKAFTAPSPIQAQCWGPLLDGKDMVGIAATGSGKTLAFLIPALLKLAKAGLTQSNKSSPRVLVVAPTRELAMQSYQVFIDVGGYHSVCIYGGVSKGDQIRELKQGALIVVATPGRLIDLMHEGNINLSEVIYLVLDEADRMLDEGFEPAIKEIVSCCAAKTIRQTVMFSATWPEEIRSLADKYLNANVIRVVVGSEELSANHRVRQIVECIEGGYAKDKRLLTLLADYHASRKNRILIFVLYKKEAVTLQNTISAKGYKVTAIHGDKSQADRTAALDEFKSGRTPLMIATDVAARGLDIPQVEYVINYSFPLTVEDYVHRIGRTGRGGASGVSHTFFTDFDKGLAGALVGVLQEAGQEVPPEIYKYPMLTKKKTSKLYGDFGPKQDLAGKKATKITFND